MSQHSFDALHLITTPVWLISPVSEQILFANAAAAKVMRNKSLNEMRRGIYSASAQTVLSMYVADLKPIGKLLRFGQSGVTLRKPR